MNVYKITQFVSVSEYEPFQTRFGGQPDWLTSPEWPISAAWNDRPMKFIGQIRLDEWYDDVCSIRMAYIFVTQPEDRQDSFFDPDIIYPYEGENAVIIQAEGRIPSCISIREHVTGPTTDEQCVWIPQVKQVTEEHTSSFEEIDIDKFGGIPACIQGSAIEERDHLLLQLHTNWLPFYINAGGAPTMFVFLKETKNEGYIMVEDT